MEVLFSSLFKDGTKFYTTRQGNCLVWGFLKPSDTFDEAKAVPKFWHGFGYHPEHYSNVVHCPSPLHHQEMHEKLTEALQGNFCPQRLRRYLR